MNIVIVQDRDEKENFIEAVDSAFPRGLVRRENYEEIFNKIDSYAVFLGAYDDEKQVGYAAIYANDQETHTAFISMIGVLDSMQGKHVGKSLMDKCIEESKNRGMNYIRLEVTNYKQSRDF